MGVIKSALELAMERAANVPADGQALQQEHLREQGAKLAAKALQGEILSLSSALKEFSVADAPYVREGLCKVLLGRLILPQTQAHLETMKEVQPPLKDLVSDCGVLLEKFFQISSEYLMYREQVKRQIDQHFEPLIRQKEAQILEKTGQRVQLSAENIPEIQVTYKEQMGILEKHYREEIDLLKKHLVSILQPAD